MEIKGQKSAKAPKLTKATPEPKKIPRKIRPSALAGKWYSAEKQALLEEVDNYLKTASRETYPTQKLFALISPHAGYTYSGLAAAYGYNRARGQGISRVIILAPSHHVSFSGASIPDATHYETPLGLVPIDQMAVEKLLKLPMFSHVPGAHAKEHSLEIQLPMLQRVLSHFNIVPLVLGRVEKNDFKEIADAIRAIIDKNTLVIASSDFTHYGPRFDYIPFEEDVKTNLRELDRAAIDLIQARDFEGFLEYKKKTGATICGFVPIAVLLNLPPANTSSHLLHYYTSGDLAGDFENSVSYVSLAFYHEGDKMENRGEVVSNDLVVDDSLDKKEQETLLRISRTTLESIVREEQFPRISLQNHDFTPKLMSERGVFVTLKKNGKLRGCIGNIIGQDALYISTIRNTISSSMRDYRFQKVTTDELADIDIEISVLTPPEPIPGPENFIVGAHGIILKKDAKEAVFLPQVAQEQGWGREETLAQLALKAGLDSDAWREGSEFLVFEAQVFGEAN